MNILLHICCAPCAIYPIGELKREGHQIAGFFYNPNIHPYSEYLKRKEALAGYSKEAGINVIFSDYEVEGYFQHVSYNEASANRCPVCWWLRLAKAAQFAKENGFDAFTTTLLGSPYQDNALINNIGADIAKNLDMAFYSKDFRPGFKDAQEKAKRMGIYRQNYCGCIYSEKEKLEKKKI